MFRHLCVFFGCIAALGVFNVGASARLLESWPYKRLFKESDLIVLAAATSTEKADDSFVDRRWPLEFAGLNTTFEVKQVVHGKDPGKKIKVLHFRFGEVRKEFKKDTGQLAIVDGPMFVGFRTKAFTIKRGNNTIEAPQPEYMLFLKKLKDDRYEPISGKIDPQLSVTAIFDPLSGDLGSSDPDEYAKTLEPTEQQLSAAKAAFAKLGGKLNQLEGFAQTYYVFDLPAETTDDVLLRLPVVSFPFGLILEGAKITDTGIQHVAKLENLNFLDLSETKVSDRSLKELTKVKNLEYLKLRQTRVTDTGLKDVAKLTNLVILNLSGTPITDAGLRELINLKHLKLLNLTSTEVTEAGMEKLQKVLPKVRIHQDAGSVSYPCGRSPALRQGTAES
jgi:Leucine Rich repeat